MMGSALAFPAMKNGNEVALVGTHLDRDIIEHCRKTGRHPKFEKDFPHGVRYCGVTLESLVIAERVARTIRRKSEKGEANLNDFPLLLHVDDIITKGKSPNLPWEAFVYEK